MLHSTRARNPHLREGRLGDAHPGQHRPGLRGHDVLPVLVAELLFIDGLRRDIARQEEQRNLNPGVREPEPGAPLGHGLVQRVPGQFRSAALTVFEGEVGLVVVSIRLPHQPLHRLRGAPPVVPQGVRLVEQIVALRLLPVDHNVGEVLREGEAVGDPVGQGVEVVVPRDFGPPAPGQGVSRPDGRTVGGVDEPHLPQPGDQLDSMHDVVLQSLQVPGEELILEIPRRGLRVRAQFALLLVGSDEDAGALLADVLGPCQIPEHREARQSSLLPRRDLRQSLGHHVLMLDHEARVVSEGQPHDIFGELPGPKSGGVDHRVKLLHRLPFRAGDRNVEPACGPRLDCLHLRIHLHHRAQPLGVLGHGVGEQGGVDVPVPGRVYPAINVVHAHERVHLRDLIPRNHARREPGVVVQRCHSDLLLRFQVTVVISLLDQSDGPLVAVQADISPVLHLIQHRQ
mmetsp:Transcript_42990/g.103606  ORF Transcript_42990/g.103606 Transcript_42990/m.103606 type:complete len:456 (-) Transcript_42990:266-1633(-)